MKPRILTSAALTMILSLIAISISAGIVAYESGADYSNYIRFDRYLDVEIWVDDDSYYEGDDINISFRANKSCYVAIYNLDSRGRLNLIYPANPSDDSWIEGNSIYRIPDGRDPYQLTVRGPDGIEYLQIVASRKPIPIPDWFNGSGMVCDDDPFDFLDYINANYFGGEHDYRRAFDLTTFSVKEWHQYYFRPIYTHYYDPWDWGYCGSVYIDYPFGATIYIDGIYWGIAPLFIPRLYYGWHYVTVYDHYGYCWEDRVNIVRHKSIVVDETVVRTKAGVKSRFKEVRASGHLNPTTNGYAEYQKDIKIKKRHQPVSRVEGKGRIKFAAEKSTRSVTKTRHKTSAGKVTKSRDTYNQTKYKSNKDVKRTKSSEVRKAERRTEQSRQKSEASSKSYRKTKTNASSSSARTGSSRKIKSDSGAKTIRKSTSTTGKTDRGNTSTKSVTRTKSSGSSDNSKKRGK